MRRVYAVIELSDASPSTPPPTHPERMIYAEAGDEKGVLTVLEDGLRHGGLAAVVGEVDGLAMTASPRLQLR